MLSPTRVLGVVLAVTVLLVGPATAAEAHNILIMTTPKNGATVAVVPAQVSLTFSEPAVAIGTILVVTGPAGQVQTGAAVLVDNTVTEHLRPGSPAGRYRVAWRVTSSDGHPVSGSFSFTALAASPGPQVAPTTSTASSPAVATSTSGAARVSGAARASQGGSSSALWWIGVAGTIALLHLMGFIVFSKTRLAPEEERDHQS